MQCDILSELKEDQSDIKAFFNKTVSLDEWKMRVEERVERLQKYVEMHSYFCEINNEIDKGKAQTVIFLHTGNVSIMEKYLNFALKNPHYITRNSVANTH